MGDTGSQGPGAGTDAGDNTDGDDLLDVIAPDGTVIGQARRDRVHREGLWHRTFHCLVVRSTSPTRVVFQRRSATSYFANKLDLTASGHLNAGEQPTEGVRELGEEVGLAAEKSDLVPVGVQLIVDHRDGARNHEQVHVFFLVNDQPLEHFIPDPAELGGVIEVETSAMLRLIDPTDIATSASGLQWDGLRLKPVNITEADLISGYQDYLAKVLIMAERLVAGQRPLAM
ncbi:MAG: NUDIX domain-containing protein [Acidimicrobiia bacterium]|nr:NUDIX domain-containing protein [Acidimicrobiia bacterium]